MGRKLAVFISVIFHPVFVNLVSLLLLFSLFPQLYYGIGNSLKAFYILFIFVSTGLLPVVIVGLLRLFGQASSIMLDGQDERTVPYLVTASLYTIVYWFCRYIDSPPLLIGYLLACSCIVVAVLIINRYTKISIHAASLGALLALVLLSIDQVAFDARILIAIILVASGLTATARLFAGAHQPYQLYTGFALGLVLMLLVL